MVNTDMPATIELQNVSHSYDGKKLTIQDVSLKIENLPGVGEFIVILGKSGCGKSTLLRYIANLAKPTLGKVLIHGEEINDDSVVGMVFQQYSSLPYYTILQNVMLPLTLRRKKLHLSYAECRERALEMIKAVGLIGHEDKYAKYPLLSGGQLQRVAIARSLVAISLQDKERGILLMDEPFGALDTNTRAEIQLLLLEIWERMRVSIVFVTHDISEAVFLADEIYIMSPNPGTLLHRIPIKLPFNRDKELKRSPEFVNMVYKIEELLSTT